MSRVTLDAAPASVSFARAEAALIVIDMQSDFLRSGGFGEFLGNDVSLLQRAIAPTQAVLEACRHHGVMVLHTREGHLPDMSDCPPNKLGRWSPPRIGDPGPMGRILIRGERGHAIVDELAPAPGEIVIDKPGKCAFYKTELEEVLRTRGITTLLVAGVTTDVCVATTVTGANDRGFDAIVLADCVASYSPARHAATLEIIQAQGGIFGWVSQSRSLIDALQCAAG